MLSLDEAIIHAKETAKKLRAMTSVTNGKPYEECLECAKEHEQLASWLEELAEYQKLFESPKEAEEVLNMLSV